MEKEGADGMKETVSEGRSCDDQVGVKDEVFISPSVVWRGSSAVWKLGVAGGRRKQAISAHTLCIINGR